jgi:acyl-CoA thioesterase FadM
VEKPAHVVAVQLRTRAEYRSPLPWQDGATIEVTTQTATERGFTQSFALRSSRTDRLVATIEHEWVWLDTSTGRVAPLPADAQTSFMALNDALADEPSR